MRTTLTLDDDVAALLRRVQQKRRESLKQVINAALRNGLPAMTAAREPQKRFRTKTIVAGARSIPNIDNVAEVLALIEGENRK